MAKSQEQLLREMIMQTTKDEALRRGYKWDETEEGIVITRPDGTVAISARKPRNDNSV